MSDEQFYLEAAQEVSNGVMDEALAAKAFAKAGGDERRMQATYIELRVAQLKASAAAEAAKAVVHKAKAGVAKARDSVLEVLKISLLSAFGFLVFLGVRFFVSEEQPSDSQRTEIRATPRAAEGRFTEAQLKEAEDLLDGRSTPLPKESTQSRATQRENAYRSAVNKRAAIDQWSEQLNKDRANANTPELIRAYNEEYEKHRRCLLEFEASFTK